MKISVITPSYKQLRWLKLCAASVADQRGVEVEHIIQDAQTGQELIDWITTHSSAKLIVEKDSGMYDAINRGFLKSTGEIVAWLNCDEQYLPGALAKVAAFFEQHPEVDVLFGDSVLLDAQGEILSYAAPYATRPPLHAQLRYVCASLSDRARFPLEYGFYLYFRCSLGCGHASGKAENGSARPASCRFHHDRSQSGAIQTGF